MNILTYLKNDAAHRTCTYIIKSDGTEEILFEGKSYTEQQFNAAFPRNAIRLDLWNRKANVKDNPDRTRTWMLP